MSKIRNRQLELPILVDVKGKSSEAAPGGQPVATSSQVASGFHKPASADDQSIYQSISNNYFRSAAKKA